MTGVMRWGGRCLLCRVSLDTLEDYAEHELLHHREADAARRTHLGRELADKARRARGRSA